MKRIEFSLFFKTNLFLTICLFLLFLTNNAQYTFVEFVVLVMASISSATILYLLLYILLFIFTFFERFIIYFSAVLFAIVNIGLVLDFLIFRLYKFHINAMVLNILMSPDAMNSIEIGFFPLLVLAIIFGLLLYFEIYLIKKLYTNTFAKKEFLNKKLNTIIIMPLILIVLIEKFTYGLSSLFGKYEMVSKFKVIPLYQPLTFSRVAAKYFDYKPEIELKNTVSTKTDLNYPLKKIEFKKDINKFNILIVMSDALRNSILNNKTAPNVEEFKKESIIFNNHHSGGNATRFGIFSMIYGINSTYWFSFLNANKGPVVFDVLKQLNYNIDIVSSTSTNWPEFRRTCYVNVQDSIKDTFSGKPWEKDQQNTFYTLNRIDSYSKENPFFTFVFFDAPHGYSFPKTHNIFNVKKENINYITATKGSTEIKSAKARYKNAVHYNDKLFGDIIKKLKDKNLYDNTMIIFTSDHGQEFYEYGFFGHNSSFSKAQTNSPLIIKLPKGFDFKINSNILTSHNDIVPTILSLIGVKNESKDYSNGFNLFDNDFKRDFVFSSNWNNNAIITNDKTYIFSNLPNKMFKTEIRDTKTYNKLKGGVVT